MPKQFQQFAVKKIEVPGKYVMSPLELKDYIDFVPKRAYFISQVQAPTGAHCHKVEEELFILLSGKCVAVIDRGKGLEEILMEGPTNAIYAPPFVWHHFKNFTPEAILLALSSTNYNPDRSDYVEDYEEFKELSEKLKK